MTVEINIAIALTGRSGCSDVKLAYGNAGGVSPNEVPTYAIPGKKYE